MIWRFVTSLHHVSIISHTDWHVNFFTLPYVIIWFPSHFSFLVLLEDSQWTLFYYAYMYLERQSTRFPLTHLGIRERHLSMSLSQWIFMGSFHSRRIIPRDMCSVDVIGNNSMTMTNYTTGRQSEYRDWYLSSSWYDVLLSTSRQLVDHHGFC